MDLNNKDSYQSLDTLKIGESLELFPDQVQECWNQAMTASIPEFKPGSIVITGMGGSSNAAKILQCLYEDDLNIPFAVYNDYGLPAWVNQDTLVIANSYSGNTEETLSGVEEAQKKAAKIMGVATGGKIGNMIKSGEISGVVVNPGSTNPSNFPKSGLGISFGALAGALNKAGVLGISTDVMTSTLSELRDIKNSWDVKETSVWLNGFMPVLFGGRPLIGSLNAGRNAMCEISRNFTQFYDFPEVDHVLVEATQKPDYVKEKIKYLFFVSNFANPRVLKRYEVTTQIFQEQGLDFKSYNIKGSTKLVQALELPLYCAWVGFYLSILQNTDPGPEPWIIKLKEALAQPVH